MESVVFVSVYALMILIPSFKVIAPRVPGLVVAVRRLSGRVRRAVFLLSLAAFLVATPGVPGAIAFVLLPFLRRSFPLGLLSSIIPAATNPHLLVNHPSPYVRQAYRAASVANERLEERIKAVLPDHMYPLAAFLAVIVREPGQNALRVTLAMWRIYSAMLQEAAKVFAQRAGFVISPFVLSIFELAIIHLAGVSASTEAMMDLVTSALLVAGALIAGEL